ncbi:MAG: xanthine dehydrogenase molybdopterin binding subunit [Stappiaceae bacterium]
MQSEIHKDDFATVRKPVRHDSAGKHVSGSATYIDDILEPEGTLHLVPGWCPSAVHADLLSMTLDKVRSAPGVVAVLTAENVPGLNDWSGSIGGDPVFVEKQILFYGQVAFAVLAETQDQARRAARLATFETEPITPLLTIRDALDSDKTVLPDYAFGRGETETALKEGAARLSGEFSIGGQEHFYLEGQAAFALPGEDDDIIVHSSTQYPSEVQHVVAKILGVRNADVTILVRRMGGGFGGKESQANQWAALAALGVKATGRPCKVRLDRDDDMIMTGKRHDFQVKWDVATDEDGRINAIDLLLASRCGYSADLSLGINDRAMFHADSSYYYPQVAIRSRRMRTNTCTNTAFRGFGGPQGMLAAERVLDAIAITRGEDALDVRKRNFYTVDRDLTPYGMPVEELDTLHGIVSSLEESCDYRTRRSQLQAFNAENHILKKGLALTPVKFGISFTLIHLNQAGALVHLYTDGSVHLNHGGTEMGQGLFVKVGQVVAEVFGVDLDRIKITATHTGKVPNTGPTAASAGSDLNGMAAKNGAEAIKARLMAFAAEKYQVSEDAIRFADNHVHIGTESVPLAKLAHEAHLARIQMSEAGFYATPKITWDRDTATGRPFLYFAYGAACSEVTIDSMTGEMSIDRVDILHDVGKSLNTAIDIGQIEGGFVQGAGWLTTEELVWDEEGRLRTHAPSTYKIPTASDVPSEFNINLWHSDGNPEETIYRSKAVGEPPVMLANSVFCAITDAVASLKPGVVPQLDAPATPEAIMKAVNLIKISGR